MSRNDSDSGPSSNSNRQRKITMEELRTHDTRKSAWMALRGKVYDVTEYVDKHPGGYSTIKQGFGTDATKLFNKVHGYVNFEKVLAGKQVGVLVNPHQDDHHLT